MTLLALFVLVSRLLCLTTLLHHLRSGSVSLEILAVFPKRKKVKVTRTLKEGVVVMGEVGAGVKPPKGEVEAGVKPPEGEVEAGVKPPEGEVGAGVKPPEGEVEAGVKPPEGEVKAGVKPLEGEVEAGIKPPEGEVEAGIKPPEGKVEAGVKQPEDEVEAVVKLVVGKVEVGVKAVVDKVATSVKPLSLIACLLVLRVLWLLTVVFSIWMISSHSGSLGHTYLRVKSLQIHCLSCFSMMMHWREL